MNMFESEPLNSNMMKLFDFHNQDVMFVLYCMTSCTHMFLFMKLQKYSPKTASSSNNLER